MFFLVTLELRGETNTNIWSGTATNAQGKTLVTIKVDTTEVPELNGWGQRAGELCVQWYPKINMLLASDGFEPSKEVQLRFHKDMPGVASTSREVINISATFVKKNTNDFGMVIHELTHVVQDYRRGRNPGWLVEGIADYIRLTHFEPQARRPRINPDRASYRDSYKTTAMFLEWVEKTYDKQLVNKLNKACRECVFAIDLFKDYTGKTVNELWGEFIDSLATKRAITPEKEVSK